MTAAWRYVAARAIGTSHAVTGAPCQDAVAVRVIDHPDGPILVAVVADGAGSAVHARDGARAVVRGFLRHAEHHFAHAVALPIESEIASWLDTIRADIASLADSRGATMRDFAATLVGVVATPTATLIAHVGDGAVVVDGKTDADPGGTWDVASWPAGGEYAGTTFFVTDRQPRLVVHILDRPAKAVALFTDGIEHMVLDEEARRAFAPFFDRMIGVVRAATGTGCDRPLSRTLRTYLRSPAVNDRTHDDKSLILAVRA